MSQKQEKAYWRIFFAEWRLLIGVLISSVGVIAGLLGGVVNFAHFVAMNQSWQPLSDRRELVISIVTLAGGQGCLFIAPIARRIPQFVKVLIAVLGVACLMVSAVEFTQFVSANAPWYSPGLALVAALLLLLGFCNAWKLMTLIDDLRDGIEDRIRYRDYMDD